MKKRVCASLALTLILVSPGWAHHNMSAIFDFDQRFTRTGTLTKTDWRNPHIGLSVDAQGDQAQVVTWSFEGPSPKFFRVRGQPDVGVPPAFEGPAANQHWSLTDPTTGAVTFQATYDELVERITELKSALLRG